MWEPQRAKQRSPKDQRMPSMVILVSLLFAPLDYLRFLPPCIHVVMSSNKYRLPALGWWQSPLPQGDLLSLTAVEVLSPTLCVSSSFFLCIFILVWHSAYMCALCLTRGGEPVREWIFRPLGLDRFLLGELILCFLISVTVIFSFSLLFCFLDHS